MTTVPLGTRKASFGQMGDDLYNVFLWEKRCTYHEPFEDSSATWTCLPAYALNFSVRIHANQGTGTLGTEAEGDFWLHILLAFSTVNHTNALGPTWLGAAPRGGLRQRQRPHLYSRSCRISTGSRPRGFWMGVMRLCFWCSGTMGAGWAGCPGDCVCGGITGEAAGGTAGGAGEGRPVG